MTPHSTYDEVEARIYSIDAGGHNFLGIGDARAVASWYIDPTDQTEAIQAFAQGQSVETLELLREVRQHCVRFVNNGVVNDSKHHELLYLLAWVGMRAGAGQFISGRE